MFRYGFSIRTRSGQRVDNISIMAPSQTDAERRLRQMYQLCEILNCQTNGATRRSDALDVESVIAMICAQPALETSVAVWRTGSRDKSSVS
jgi:hypothetical protein